MVTDPLVGKLLDSRYEVTRRIGGGGMGNVYEAQHAGTGRRVAIKVISTGDAAKDAQLVGRFQREAKAAGAVDTQHICQVLDTGTDPDSGLPYMVMEYMVGEDMMQLLQRLGVLPVELALRIVAQSCIGLQKAHESGVVHRDIKPANLFLARREGSEVLVKLLDFGIAKVAIEHASAVGDAGLTRTGTMLGSPLYMSPEQARGSKNIDHRADVWSLGIVLYQAMSGRTPYDHIDALGELIIAICSETPRPVQDIAPWVSKDAATIVHRALRPYPNERYQTAAEMLNAVKALLPSGTSLDESMLVPLSDAERANVGARLTITAPEPAMRPQSFAPPAMNPPGAIPAETTNRAAGTTGGVATERPPAKSSNTKLIAIGATLGVLGAGLVAWQVSKKPQPMSGAAAAETVTVTSARPQTAPSSSAAPSPQVTLAEDRERKQLVTVLPDDATVSVDGTAISLSDGMLSVKGGIGTNHDVHISVVRSGKTFEKDVRVSITEDGPNPAKIALDAPPAPPKIPVASGPNPPAPSAPATAAPTSHPAIETKFGND